MPSYIINIEYGAITSPANLIINVGGTGVPVDPPDPVFEADYGGGWGISSSLPQFDSQASSTSGTTLTEVTQCKLLAGRLATDLETWSQRISGDMFGDSDGAVYHASNDVSTTVETGFYVAGETLDYVENCLAISSTTLAMDGLTMLASYGTLDSQASTLRTTVNTIPLRGYQHSTVIGTMVILEDSFVVRFGDQPSLEVCQEYPDHYYNGKYTINVSATLTDASVINITATPTYQICKLIQKGDSFPIFNEVEIPDAIVIPPSVIIPPTRKTYMFNHTIQCFRAVDDTEINVTAATVSIDKDQLHYTYSLNLGSANDKALINNQEFKLTINGFDYHGIVEQVSTSESFGQTSYSARGRSLSVKLTEPYSLPRTYTNSTATTWRQAIEAEATLAGFTVTYESFHSQTNLDWALPIGILSYTDKTPLQAISRLCEVVGAVCHSHPSTETIIIKPRYKIPLWLLDGATEDFIIPQNLHADFNVTETRLAAYDSLYLSGENQGVNRHVKLTGSAGTKPKLRQLDALFTDQVATVERGVSELSEVGTMTNADLTTMMFYNAVDDQLPPIPVGSIVSIKGVKYDVQGWRLSASRVQVNKVRQSISLIRQTT